MSIKGKPFHETIVPYLRILVNMWTTHSTPMRDDIFRHDFLAFVEHLLIPTIIPSGHQEIAEGLIQAYDILFFGAFKGEKPYWDNEIIMRALREKLGLQLVTSSCEDMHGCWSFDKIEVGDELIDHVERVWKVTKVRGPNEDYPKWKHSLEILCISDLAPIGHLVICLLEDGRICDLSSIRPDGTVAIVSRLFCNPDTLEPRGRVIVDPLKKEEETE